MSFWQLSHLKKVKFSPAWPNCYSVKFEYIKSDADLNPPIANGSKRTQPHCLYLEQKFLLTKTKSISCLKLNLTCEKIMYGRGQLKTLHFLVLWPIHFFEKESLKTLQMYTLSALLCIDIWFSIQLTLSLSFTLIHCSVDICRWYYHYFVYQY